MKGGSRFVIAVGGALLLACGSSMMKLDAKKVRSVNLRLVAGGDTVCPNAALFPEVVAVIAYTDGKVFETRTPNNEGGKLRPTDLEWSAEVGAVAENGVWVTPWDFFPWHDRRFTVRASIPTRPELAAALTVTPRYDCGGIGEYGGLDAISGLPEGTPGGRGPRLEVALAYVDTTLNGRLVLVRVIDRDYGRRGYYLVDPRAKKRFVIVADGGDGAPGRNGAIGRNGSSGTRGMDGGAGGVCENGQDGAPGSDGEDGTDGYAGTDGGDGGSGGAVMLTYPAAFPELAGAIDITVEGGTAGPGGSGGHGGAGGDAGRGGSGGSAGPSSDPERACTTYGGSDGLNGAEGRDGQSGADGATGRAGDRGVVSGASTAGVEELFAFELARGWKVVR